MAWLLDTNIVVHLIEGDATVAARLAEALQPIAISAISRVELENGVYRPAERQEVKREALQIFLATVDVLAFDNAVAGCYADIVATMGYSRSRVFDRMIAAQALNANLTLVTRNTSDFRDIPDLKIESW